MDTKGFSLLELMVVVIIVGVLAAVAAPNMNGWMAKRTLNSATRDLASDIRWARSEAVNRNQNVSIQFSDANGSYEIIANGVRIKPQQVMPSEINLTSNFLLDDLVFSQRGIVSDENNPNTVTLVSASATAADNTRTITVTLGGSLSIAP